MSGPSWTGTWSYHFGLEHDLRPATYLGLSSDSTISLEARWSMSSLETSLDIFISSWCSDIQWTWEEGIFCLRLSFCTAGYPAGEEGCQGLVCPLPAWEELLIRMAEAGDTTGARASDLETSEEQPLACPPTMLSRWQFLPSTGHA